MADQNPKQDPEEAKEPAAEKESFIEGEILQPPPAADEPEGLPQKIAELMRELNFSARHLWYSLGCLILIPVLIFSGYRSYLYFTNRLEKEPQKPPYEIPSEQTGLISGLAIGSSETADPAHLGDTGIPTTVNLGTEEETDQTFPGYVETFLGLDRAYRTDIHELLDKSTDRRARLQSHLLLLKSLRSESRNALTRIEGEIAITEAAYEMPRQKQQESDRQFFLEINNFNGAAASRQFETFVERSRQVVFLRARFKALQKIRSMYVTALPKVDARIKDLELNEEPLIAGIKVYDVRGSNLNLIESVDGGTKGAPSESLDSSSFPLFPVHPSQVKTERDFIMN